jgi:cobalt/nickel transport system permease protein
LRGTSGLAADAGGEALALRPAGGSLRRLWIAVAALMLLTPLGILAAGTAWGEWSPTELAKASAQNQVAKSATNAMPAAVPSGLQRLANLWTAPFPAYAPGFVKSRAFGYFLSAMFAVGFLLALSLSLQHFLQKRGSTEYSR